MNVLSLFDGISCGQLALERAGIDVTNYYASEIDKYAIQVATKNYPCTTHLGDIRGIKGCDLPKIDLIIGGSPCQGFSFAGKQRLFDDPRSQLFFEYVRLVKECQPKYFLLENVPMKQECQAIISKSLGVEPILINSALVSAQSRKRLYWTNISNVTQPKDKGIVWQSVRDHGVNEYYYTDKGLAYLARVSHREKLPLKTYLENGAKFNTLTTSYSKGACKQRFFGIPDLPSDETMVAALRGRYLKNGVRQDHKMLTAGLTTQYLEFRYDAKSNALTTVGKDNVVVPFTLPNHIPRDEFFFRHLTPLEAERLQTLPDNYTECVSKTQRLRAIGNAWTVDVVSHILKGL